MKSINREIPATSACAPLSPATLRVLLLEDDLNDAELIAAELASAEGVAIALTHVETLADARALLAAGEYRLTLADLSLSDSKGVDTIRRLVEIAPGPVIALTGHDDAQLRAEVLTAGAYDFIGKGELKGLTLARVIRLAGVQSRTAETLERMRERHRVLIEHSTDGIALFDRDGTVLYGSPATRRILGYSSVEATGRAALDLAHPDDRKRCRAKFLAALAQPGTTVSYVARFRHKSDSYRVLEGTLINLLDEPSVAGVVANYRDVTDRNRADERLQRLQRMYAALSATNEAILHARTPDALYAQMCHVAVAHGGYAIAAVRLLDSATGALVPATASGECAQWMALLSASIHPDTPNGCGPDGIAAREGRAAFVNDVSASAAAAHWHAAARANGIAATASVPIRRGGIVVGILSVWARETTYFDDELLRLLERMADNVSFALDAFDRNDERAQAEAALRASEARFRTVIESLNEGILVYDLDHHVIAGNALAARIIGTPLNEILGKPGFTSLFPCVNEGGTALVPEDRPTRVTVRTGREQTDRILGIRRPDGSTTWLSINTAFLRHPGATEHYGLVSTLKDITERKRTEARRVAQLNHQQLIAELGRRALLRKDLAALLDDSVRLLAQGLRVSHAALYELAPGGDVLVLRASTGAVHTDTEHPVPTTERTPIGGALALGTAMVTDDIDADPLLLPPDTPWADGLKSWMSVAVRGGARPRGVLMAASAQTAAFGPDACAFIEAAASVLSSALLRHESESRLAYLAQFDALTGLPNRTLLRDRLERAIVQARRKEWRVAVLFVDLDRFKLVNDTLGHEYGDRLLAEVGKRLSACVRNGDTVGRVSGDEFVVLLADLARADDAGLIAQKIIDALSKPFTLEGHEAYVSASVGVALYPNDSDDAEALLRNADAAMYRAKESGRSGYCFFTAEMNARSRQRLQLQGQLRRAVERDEFRLVYQPKIDLASGRLCGLEALLRWQHPERSSTPAEFIPILEETGLIVAVGEWVIRTACAQMSAWRAAGFAPVPIAVNVSARQFQLKDFDARVVGLLRATGVEPSLLEIEITESYLAPDPEHAIRLLGNLQRAGIRVAIDDFGTGYSSLAYLTRFPVSSLKIEGQFVRDATTDPSDGAIVRAVIDMANNLGFVVVAEGVETHEQVAFLQEHGCDQAQGYYYARPASAEDVQAWLSPRQPDEGSPQRPTSRRRMAARRRFG